MIGRMESEDEGVREGVWADLLIRAVILAACLGVTGWAYGNGHDGQVRIGGVRR